MSRDTLATGLALRKAANDALQAKNPGKAVEGFTLAIKGPDGASNKNHMAALHTGRAAAYIVLRGYHFAMLDACAALQYNEKYYRAFEKRALARKGVLGFDLAAEDYLDAAACSNEPNYKRRMKAEAEAMMDEDEALQRTEVPEFSPMERDFAQARIVHLSRGDDLSKNSTALCVLKAYDEIDSGWHRFYETCDPESDDPDLCGLIMVLEAAAVEPRAAHFTCRGVPTEKLLEKLDAVMERHRRSFSKGGEIDFTNMVLEVGFDGPGGAVSQTNRWLVLNLVSILQTMTKGYFEYAGDMFIGVLKAYVKLINAKLLSERLSRGPRLWDLIIFCAYRVLLTGGILGDQDIHDFVADLTENVRDEYEGLEEGNQDPLVLQSRKRCLARAYAVEAFFSRAMARTLDKTDYFKADNNVYWPNQGLTLAAYEKASKAIELLSNDDEEKAIAETLALCCEMESTSVVLREVLSTSARIHCIRHQSSKFFGARPSNEICRELLEFMLGKLPDIYLHPKNEMSYRTTPPPKTLDDFLDLRLRRTGTIMINGDDSVPVPDYRDEDVLRYMKHQRGDMSLWFIEAMPDVE